MEIPETGWFALFTDPTGNQIGLYTPMERPA
jgi:predicted enzyme related to lactoylglutathione lyase